jgi:hypothetical protein
MIVNLRQGEYQQRDIDSSTQSQSLRHSKNYQSTSARFRVAEFSGIDDPVFQGKPDQLRAR